MIKKHREQISANYLRSILRYDPLTGELRWRRTKRKAKAGAIAGSTTKFGHRQVTIDGVTYPAHRVAWCMHYGSWPDGEVDHRNRVPGDNRIENLRVGSHGQNIANAKLSKKNRTGVRGVRETATGRYSVRVGRLYLGTFDTIEQASAARDAGSVDLFGPFAATH